MASGAGRASSPRRRRHRKLRGSRLISCRVGAVRREREDGSGEVGALWALVADGVEKSSAAEEEMGASSTVVLFKGVLHAADGAVMGMETMPAAVAVAASEKGVLSTTSCSSPSVLERRGGGTEDAAVATASIEVAVVWRGWLVATLDVGQSFITSLWSLIRCWWKKAVWMEDDARPDRTSLVAGCCVTQDIECMCHKYRSQHQYDPMIRISVNYWQ